MELFVVSPNVRFTNLTVAPGSTVSDLIDHFAVKEGASVADFYVKSNGRVSHRNASLQSGVVYRVEPRLCGGKGGFGSMLRALGAQIEKTTNREACRDLSGRRLRDVNHEKEMAEWLKKQADREAEKEQRRLERIQRKLAEPKHYFTDTDYEKQCHDLSERLEDSVLKGMQASSSGLVKADEGPSRKRPTPADSKKKAKKKCFWTGLGGLEEIGSSGEGSDDSDSEASLSTSGASRSSDVPKPTVPPSATRGSDRTDPQEQPSSSSSSSSQSPAPSSPTQVEKEVQKECTAESSQNRSIKEDKSSQNPALSSTTQEGEELQKNAEKECTAETSQNGSIEEYKSSQSPAPSSPTQVEEEEEEVQKNAEKECTAETSQNGSIEEDQSSQSPAPSSPTQVEEEVQKECTAETSQNSSIEEDKSSQSPAPSSPTQVEEEVQKECTAETSQNVDKSQVEPTEAPSGPAESSQAQEEVEGLLDLLSVSGPGQLEALGLERLKKELMERGMKCGGTLQERAARLFSVKGLSPDQIDPALLAKPTKGKKK
ncbi:protein SDE2 homolog isoform X1 [Sinocyclocheilus rhinocerous]|uniref:protein SDE2 homolog isoform X1 n=1 Tax=Sinocyclocheilus rhinocerous TaxID=307959 RepID=UPI0007B7BE05|nr:PREDICTED: protein SDE2 homolog isoform X1 [Sinocyclocheilus rhinocerous]